MILMRHFRSRFGNCRQNLLSVIRFYNELPFEDIPEVSPAFIKRVFKQNSISFEEGFTNFIINCPICHTKAKASPKTYINKTTGLYMCSSCKHTGQWNDLENYLIIKKRRTIDKKEGENVLRDVKEVKNSLTKIQESTKMCKDLPPEKIQLILEKFKLPNVSDTVIASLNIRMDLEENNLYFPLENVESEIVGYKRLNFSNNEVTIIPSITCGGLLTGRAAKSKDTAVLVPTIADFLVLMDSKISNNVVCLPNGVNSLSQYVLPSLERFKKLILWFGTDIKSWDSAKQFAQKLGEKRCYFIRPSEKQPLPHLDTGQDFKKIMSAAHTIWHKSITTFATLRDDVLSDLQNVDKVQGVKWKRFPTLNKTLKGHRRGELTVITGSTGCGKTTFVSEYSLDLAMQGVNTLWGSFEIRNARLARTMLQQMAGVSLEENINLFDKLADQFEKLPIHFLTFHGQQPIKIVMEAVEHATYVYDIAHVIIDNVQFMMGLTEEHRHMDRFWKQDAIIDGFRTFATRKNCHVTLVIHPRKEKDEDDLSLSSIFGGAKATQEADNVFIIQDKRLTSLRGKKYLQVAKNRYSGDLGMMVLDFDKSSLSFATKKIKPKTRSEDTKSPEEIPRNDKNVT